MRGVQYILERFVLACVPVRPLSYWIRSCAYTILGGINRSFSVGTPLSAAVGRRVEVLIVLTETYLNLNYFVLLEQFSQYIQRLIFRLISCIVQNVWLPAAEPRTNSPLNGVAITQTCVRLTLAIHKILGRKDTDLRYPKMNTPTQCR